MDNTPGFKRYQRIQLWGVLLVATVVIIDVALGWLKI